MRALAAAALLIAAAAAVPASSAQAQAPGEPRRTILSLRSDEDWRPLPGSAQALRDDPWDRFKFIGLGPDAWLTLGGELRERFEWFSQPGFGLRGPPGDRTLFHRLLLHADLHVTDNARLFVQLGSMLEAGKQGPLASTDRDRLDLQQAFLDLRLPLGGIAPRLRIGRQEIAFGSQRLVSVRESPNTRRSFDGVRVTASPGGAVLDAFVVQPVVLQDGVFDDRASDDQLFWGVYATTPLPGRLGALDLYYLGLRNDQATFGGSTGRELRHSFGLRLFGGTAGWDWNLEPVLQVGDYGGSAIRAWTVASDTGFTFASLPWTPRLGLKANIASGDRDRGDGRLGTFNPLFPKLANFNEASLVAPANFFDVYPTITLRPARGVVLTLGWDFLWRTSVADAVYVNPFTALAGSAGVGGRRIGDQIALDAAWQVDRHLLLSASYVRFNAGSAVRAVGGRSVDFAMMQAQYRF
jgi:hypothetical protein